MPRFTFDIYSRKEKFILLPINLICRKRDGDKVKPEHDEEYLGTIEASSYENTIGKIKLALMNSLRSKL